MKTGSKPSRRVPALAFSLGLAASPVAFADEGAAFRSGVDVGFDMVDDDGFALIRPRQDLAWEGLVAVLAPPLRFRVLDRSPEDEGAIRNQDWDEPSDWARIVPRLSFTREWNDADLEILAGELNGVTVGHGTIAAHYFNSLDMDRYQGGLWVLGQGAGNGLEVLVDDLVAPEILLGRAFVAPVAWFVDGEWPRRFEIGATLGADLAAPRSLSGDGDTTVPVAGGDVSFRLVDESWLGLEPYIDVNLMDGEIGVHAGAVIDWTISEEIPVNLEARGEYRRVGSDYHPAVFNPFYDSRRLAWSEDEETGDTRTFADHLALVEDGVSNAFMVEVSFEANWLRVGSRYDREGGGRPHWLMFRAEAVPWEPLRIAAFYAGLDNRGGSGLFSRDALIGAEARGRVVGPLDVFASYTRCWRDEGGEMRFANEILAGAGVSITY